VILGRSTPVIKSIVLETKSIPTIFVVVSDPVGDGIVSSIARPGGNVTGFTNVEASLGGKWLEVLKEVSPTVVRAAVIFDPKTSPGGGFYYSRLVESAASLISIKAVPMPVHDAGEIERGIVAFARELNGGLIVLPDVTTGANRDLIVRLAAAHRLPAIYSYRYIVAEGGLASYGVDVGDLYLRAADYVDRVLRGEQPGDLPVQAPLKFELVINLKTAKALGLTLPPTLLGRADEVIE
jgi:putative ABC transport system substrate-binding protein